ACAGERLSGVAGWNGIASLLQLDHGLKELVVGLSGAAHPCLVIDGVDKVEDPGARRAVNDLLGALSRIPAGAGTNSRWSVVLTTKAESLETVREWLEPSGTPGAASSRRVEVVRVPDLTDDDVAAIATSLPHLRSVLTASRISPVLRNPYFLNVIEQSLESASEQTGSPGTTGQTEQPTPITEADVLKIWWEHL